jgi:hypothetical protein
VKIRLNFCLRYSLILSERRGIKLKGAQLDLSSASIGELTSENLNISSDNVENLISGTSLNGVVITNSEINNTIIGLNGATPSYFTYLEANGDVVFNTLDRQNYVNWDSQTGLLSIKGELSIDGCVTIGNIQICKNTISIISNTQNGNDINIVPNGLGSIYLTGPINNIVNSVGNYLTSLANGNASIIASDYLNFTSLSSGSIIRTFSDQILESVNGNIYLNTDSGLNSKLITNIYQSSGNVVVTTFSSSGLKVNDVINITGSNSIPIINGEYVITRIINTFNFNISTGSGFSGIISNGNSGIINKVANNNIFLNASKNILIPNKINSWRYKK